MDSYCCNTHKNHQDCTGWNERYISDHSYILYHCSPKTSPLSVNVEGTWLKCGHCSVWLFSGFFFVCFPSVLTCMKPNYTTQKQWMSFINRQTVMKDLILNDYYSHQERLKDIRVNPPYLFYSPGNDINLSSYFKIYSQFLKSQESLQIASHVTRTLLLWTAQAWESWKDWPPLYRLPTDPCSTDYPLIPAPRTTHWPPPHGLPTDPRSAEYTWSSHC